MSEIYIASNENPSSLCENNELNNAEYNELICNPLMADSCDDDLYEQNYIEGMNHIYIFMNKNK